VLIRPRLFRVCRSDFFLNDQRPLKVHQQRALQAYCVINGEQPEASAKDARAED
jgi:hypothetical protein